MSTVQRITLVLWGLSLSACIEQLEPDVGEVRAGLCRPRDSDPNSAVSFSEDIQPLFEREQGGGCGCHISGEGRASGIQQSGLDLTNYRSLMRGGDMGGEQTVVPYDPCASILVQKVGPGVPFGNRMPPAGPPYWTPNERRLLSDWVAEGAYDN